MKLLIVEALFVVAVVLMCLFVDFHPSSDPAKLPVAEVIGIDISHYQGKVNWDNLQFNYSAQDRTLVSEISDKSREVDFIIAKATEGTTLVDRFYEINKKECEQRGIPFSAYHYFKPNSSPESQARFFIEVAALGSGNIVPVVDVEERGRLSNSDFQNNVKRFAEIIEKEYGTKPLIYCSLLYYNSYFNNKAFKEYRFWIAAYSRKEIHVNYTMWQMSDKARLGGVRGRVDVNVFNGTKEEFNNQMLM